MVYTEHSTSEALALGGTGKGITAEERDFLQCAFLFCVVRACVCVCLMRLCYGCVRVLCVTAG